MAEMKQNENTVHELYLHDRKRMTVSGVTDVISFDDTCVRLETVRGELVIDGEKLKISRLDTAKGDVDLDGSIDSVVYYDKDKTERKGFFGRLRS